MQPDEVVPTMAVFPLLGVGQFWHLPMPAQTIGDMLSPKHSPRPSQMTVSHRNEAGNSVTSGNLNLKQQLTLVPVAEESRESSSSSKERRESHDEIPQSSSGTTAKNNPRMASEENIFGTPQPSKSKSGIVPPTLLKEHFDGSGGFTTGGTIAKSLFVPDEIIFPHPRFGTLTKNIRQRRGEKVEIARPKFIDDYTEIRNPANGPNSMNASRNGMNGMNNTSTVPQTVAEADGPSKTVYADAMAFGMGCCCLQVTFQAANLCESRHLYDHLAVLTPVMMALTAASPYLRGWLTAEDVRWGIVAQSVDCRTAQERGARSGFAKNDMYGSLSPGMSSSNVNKSREAAAEQRQRNLNASFLAGNGERYLRKSRYGGIDCYLGSGRNADEALMAELHNDQQVEAESQHMERLMIAGVDRILSRHVAHLFVRDPLVIFADRVNLDDRRDVDHWESLQSTNWQSVRWKPPHPEKAGKPISSEDHVGWRVEFRTMELQMTDFENAAFTVFVVLISRVLLALELNLYIPISKLEENMRTAHKMNAATEGKFWFRKWLLPYEVCSNLKERTNDFYEKRNPDVETGTTASSNKDLNSAHGLSPSSPQVL